MAVTGLEQGWHCVDRPIPVTVQLTDQPNVQYIRFNVGHILTINGGEGLLDPIPNEKRPVVYRSPDGLFRFDAAPWLKLLFSRFLENTLQYTATEQEFKSPRTLIGEITIEQGSEVTMTYIHTFTRCVLPNTQSKYEFNPKRAWRYLPFSWHETNTGGGAQRFLKTIIPTGESFSVSEQEVEFINERCQGTYLRWLNQYGQFSYWFFPKSRELTTESEEHYRVPRNPVRTQTKNRQDTVGFSATKTIKLLDKIPKKYWWMFESLTFSPEVYMLDNEHLFAEEVTSDMWTKIIQTEVKFERTEIQRTSADFEAEFDLDELYTQTWL